MNLRSVDRIVNALLYEGYILYPYRASSVKNHMRFNFGVVYPRPYAESQSGNDAGSMQTQCLVSGDATASLEICVRFLRIVDRVVGDCVVGIPGESFRALPSLEVDGQVHESWQEAVECRVDLPVCSLTALAAAPLRHEISLGWEQEEEPLYDSRGHAAGAILRTREALQGVVEASVDAVSAGLWRITVRILNTTGMLPGSETHRELALLYSLISAHTVLGVHGGEFISLLEPPAEFRDAASACHNEGTWPVLAGDPGQKDTVLSSPIILYDYPAIAPESPGDLFDSTEIDEILTLRVMTMSDQEKVEARRIDERARRILERADVLDPEQFAKLHGTFRDAGGTVMNEMDWQLLEDRTQLEYLEIAGEKVRAGSRVRLNPRKGGDIFDLALAGQAAIVESLEEDYEGRRHVAVVLEDDPGRDLGMLRQPGHRFFFSPEEIEPLPSSNDTQEQRP